MAGFENSACAINGMQPKNLLINNLWHRHKLSRKEYPFKALKRRPGLILRPFSASGEAFFAITVQCGI